MTFGSPTMLASGSDGHDLPWERHISSPTQSLINQVVCAPVEGTESSTVSCAGGGCRDISVDKKAMASLRRGAWVSSEVINFIGKVVFESDAVLFLGTYFFLPLSLELTKPMTDTALQQKVARNIHPETSTQVYFPTPDPRSKWRRSIFTYKYIEVPIHVHDGHYVLVHIDVTARTVSLLDSLHGKKHGLGPGEAPPILDRVVWFLEWYAQEFRVDGPSSSWKSVVSEGHPLQTDNSSCGIMTLLYAWYLTRGDEPSFMFSSSLIARARTCIAACVLEYSVPTAIARGSGRADAEDSEFSICGAQVRAPYQKNWTWRRGGEGRVPEPAQPIVDVLEADSGSVRLASAGDTVGGSSVAMVLSPSPRGEPSTPTHLNGVCLRVRASPGSPTEPNPLQRPSFVDTHPEYNSDLDLDSEY